MEIEAFPIPTSTDTDSVLYLIRMHLEILEA